MGKKKKKKKKKEGINDTGIECITKDNCHSSFFLSCCCIYIYMCVCVCHFCASGWKS